MIVALDQAVWNAPVDATVADSAVTALEDGAVLHLPRLGFETGSDEQRLFSTGLAGASKNVSYVPAARSLAGSDAAGHDRDLLAGALARFSGAAVALARALFPPYAGSLEVARASFRPAEIAGRQTSWRKDDTRLHVDSFPSSPTGGRRILRVFANVNPEGRPRMWRIGGPFVEIVSRYQSRLRLPWPGQAALMHTLRITKQRRTAYDALMLQLHDLMKRDDGYQRAEGHPPFAFASGTTWIAFTDQVSHAAMAGQYQFEQTVLVPLAAMKDPGQSPVRILERAMGRVLV